MPNRLAASTSPYLKQHQDNPIDWYEWCDEAFATAKEQDKPILLSVGYATCHWCHVMAHESFEDQAVADILNENFICIKLDREERPDIDEAYMIAVQLIAGRGGWPMTVFMTHDKKPFFAGTYFPREDQGKYPGIISLAKQISTLWKTRRKDVLDSANQIASSLSQVIGKTLPSLTSTVDPKLFKDTFAALRASFDGNMGGFGPAPKFPPHTSLSYLLDYAGTHQDDAAEALGMVFHTLSAMVRGGIHDQIGGGFHRYSTDEHWLLPHFEKMLYDNALMLGNLQRASRIANAIEAPESELFEKAQINLIEWVKSEMIAPNGMFYSAIDADSDGEEGLFYLWSVEDIKNALGEKAEAFIADHGIFDEGNYIDEASRQKTGLNVIHRLGGAEGDYSEEYSLLAAAQLTRNRPITDIKCVAASNGMLISSLAESEEILAAERCAQAWIKAYETHGEFPHQVVNGIPSGAAFLDDFAHMILGFVTLASVSGKEVYYKFAETLALHLDEFEDSEKGGFFFTSDRHETVFGRSKPSTDQPVPSPNATAAMALIQLGQVERAEKTIMSLLGIAQKSPESAEALVHAAMFMVMAKAQKSEGPSVASLIGTPEPPKPVGKVQAKLVSSELIAVNGEAKGEIIVEIPEGLHLNTNTPPARWLVPTELVCEPVKIKPSYPVGENDQLHGTISIPFVLLVNALPEEFELTLKFQACTDLECLAPGEIRLDGVILPG